ncbi:MAG: family 16 glycosylhydrolase [Syntrophobacteraceae bacterium]
MRRIILALFLIFLFAINAYAQYQFDDEFNGSSVNTNAWALFKGYLQNGNNELQYYQPANVTESNGYLNITTDYVNPPVEGKSYISGRAQTNTFNFLYGTVTVRALLPGGTGPWPAIWLLGADCQASAGEVSALCNWPYSGSNEIDMTEILDSDLTKVNQQIHTMSGNTQENPGCTATTTDVSQNWHTYTLIWAPGSVTWQIDGRTTCTETSYVPSTPMYLIINTAVGGDGGGKVDDSTLPQTMLVDYVHVTTTSTPIYQVSPSAGANGSISPSSAVTVNPGNTTTFSVTPNAGYYAAVGGTCGGSLSGSTYTTGEIMAPCTVTASFSATNPGPSATVPYAPTDVTATAGNGQATVSFKLPANGGSTITGYTVTSSPVGITASGKGSPITVNGLKNGTAYTFTVTATNAIGTSQASTPSNSVTLEANRRERR